MIFIIKYNSTICRTKQKIVVQIFLQMIYNRNCYYQFTKMEKGIAEELCFWFLEYQVVKNSLDLYKPYYALTADSLDDGRHI